MVDTRTRFYIRYVLDLLHHVDTVALIADEHDLHVLTQTSFSDAGSNGHFQIDIASDIVNILRIQPNTVLLVCLINQQYM